MDQIEKAKSLGSRYWEGEEKGKTLQGVKSYLQEMVELSNHFTELLKAGKLDKESEEAAFELLRNCLGAAKTVSDVHHGASELFPPLREVHRVSYDLAQYVLQKRGKGDMLDSYLAQWDLVSTGEPRFPDRGI